MARLRGAIRLWACFTAALAFCTLAASRAAAQNPFTIDGIVPGSGVTTPPLTQVGDPYGSVKELGAVNSSTTKVGNIHLDAVPTLDFTNPNGQVDLRRIWLQTAEADDGDLWLYFAWERDADTGSGFIAFEFQQAAASPSCVYHVDGQIDQVLPKSAAEQNLIDTCNPWAGRQPGDFMILWDQQGGSLDIYKRVFLTTGVFGPPEAIATSAAAYSITGGEVAANFGGEAAINLTDEVFVTEACKNYANIIPGTVTGNSDTADYKDSVLSEFPDISNCGTVVVEKATEPNETDTGTFPYTLDRVAGAPLRYDGTKSFGETLTSGGDSDTYIDLIAGDDYQLVEGTLQSPWVLESIICSIGEGPGTDITNGGTFKVVVNETTTCVITNKRNQGYLKVIKNLIQDNGGSKTEADFQLCVYKTGNPDTLVECLGGTPDGVIYTFDADVQYKVLEPSTFAGYNPPDYSSDCTGTIVTDETKVCTVTNDDIPPSLTLVKHVINDNGGTKLADAWTLTAAGPTGFSGTGACDVAQTCLNATLVNGASFDAGSYSLTESANDAVYVASAWTCKKDGGEAVTGSAITIGLAEDWVCEITNDDAKAAPSGSTAQRAVLHDTFSITTGIRPCSSCASTTVTLQLYSDSSCTTMVHQEVITVNADAPNLTASTVTGYLDLQASESQTKTYYWKAIYSGNAYNERFSTTCGTAGERTTLTFEGK